MTVSENKLYVFGLIFVIIESLMDQTNPIEIKGKPAAGVKKLAMTDAFLFSLLVLHEDQKEKRGKNVLVFLNLVLISSLVPSATRSFSLTNVSLDLQKVNNMVVEQ